jgi:hypothetical protein
MARQRRYVPLNVYMNSRLVGHLVSEAALADLDAVPAAGWSAAG